MLNSGATRCIFPNSCASSYVEPSVECPCTPRGCPASRILRNLVLHRADRIFLLFSVSLRAFIKEDAYVAHRLNLFRSSWLPLPNSHNSKTTH